MNCAEKLQRNTHDILIIKTEDEEQFRKKFKEVNLERRCTVCNATTKNAFYPHPALRVIVCENCLVSYENTVFLSHKDGTDQNCRWCAKLAERYCCSKCTTVFCEACLSRNFGNDFITTKFTNCEGWSCLFCEPKQLWALRAAYAHAIDAADTENMDSDVWKEKALSKEVRKLAQQFLILTKNDFQSFADKIQAEVKNFCYIVDEAHLETYVDVERQVCRIAAFCGVIVKFITQLNEDQGKHFYSWSENNFNSIPKIDLGILPLKVLPSLSKTLLTSEPLINNIVKIEQTEVENLSTSTILVTDDFQNTPISPAPYTSIQFEAYDISEIKNEQSPKSKFKLSLNKPPDTNTLLSSVSSQDSLDKFLDKIHKPISVTDNCSENIPTSIPLYKELRVSLVDFRKHPQPSQIQSIKCEVADNVSIFSKATEVFSDGNTEPFCEDDILLDVRLTTTLCDKTGDFFHAYVEDSELLACSTEQPNSEATNSQEDSENHRDWEAVSLSANNLFTEENTKLGIEEEDAIIEQEVDSQTMESNKDDTCSDNEEASSVENESASPSFLARTCAMEALSDSDDLTNISSDSSTSSDSSSDSVSSLETKIETLTRTKHSKSKPNGYIKTMNLAEELEKLHKNNTSTTSSQTSNRHDLFSNSSSSSESDDEDIIKGLKNWQKPTIYSSSEDDETIAKVNTPTIDDPKLKQICEVHIAKINFDHCFGLQRKGDSDVFKILDKSHNRNDNDEFRRLTTLKPLKSTTSNSSDSSDYEKLRVRKKKKYYPKSKLLRSSDYETDSTSSSNSDTDASLTTIDLTDHPYRKDDVIDILITTDDSDVEYLSNDSEAEKINDKNKISDKPKNELAKKSVTQIPLWRKDKLLVSSFNVRDPEASTSNFNAEEDMEKQEEMYLQKIKNKQILKRKRLEQEKAISLSDDSSDEDISLLSKKRKLSPEDEKLEMTQSKIGRKNIREVLDDSQLQAKTQKADKEEEKRRERISTRHKLMDSILSQPQSSEEIMNEEIGLVLDIDNETKQILVEIPHVLVTRLKKHQTEGIKFMWDICFESVKEIENNSGTGCILAHCMGLGKTLQVILLTYAVLTNPLINMKHVVVVCPLSTVFNWQMEFEESLKAAPKKINVFDVRPANQKNFNHKVYLVRAWWDNGGVLIISYDSYTTLVQQGRYGKMPYKYYLQVKQALVNPGPDMIICDEGHILKNDTTLKCKALSKVKTRRRIMLTGTPLQNNLKEYYHMVNFAKPHLLGTAKEFANRFINPIQNGQYEDSSTLDIQLMKKRSHILHKKLETTVHRYGVGELKKYLPLKHDYVLYVKLTELQITLYEKYLELPRKASSSKMLFNYYHDLQNIWTHPALLQLKFEKKKTVPAPPPPPENEDIVDPLEPDIGFDDNWFRELMPSDLIDLKYSNKMVILFAIIEECIEFDDKLLVFSSCMSELDLIEGFLSAHNFKGNAWIKGQDFFRLDGNTNPDQRTKYCQSFNDPNNTRVRLFLVSHKVGGLGLNLIAANRVVLMDVSWNPSYDVQSVFRIYRFGQTKECYVYRLISVGTMEELVYTRAVTKLATSCRVVDEQQIQRHFKEDDKQKLYRLTKDFPEPPAPKMPSDRLVAKLWEHHRKILYKFCDHQSLLKNQTEEELNDEEMKVAWEEFRKEEEDYKTAKAMDLAKKQIQPPKIPGPVMSNMSNFNSHADSASSTNPLSRVNSLYHNPIMASDINNIVEQFKQSAQNSILPRTQSDNPRRYKKPLLQALPNQRQVPNDIENINAIQSNNIDRALQSQYKSPTIQNNYPPDAPIYSTTPQISKGGVNPHATPIQQPMISPPLNSHATPIQQPTTAPPLNSDATPMQQRMTAPPLNLHAPLIQQPMTARQLSPPICDRSNYNPTPRYPTTRYQSTTRDQTSTPSYQHLPGYQPYTNYQPLRHYYKPIGKNAPIPNLTGTNPIIRTRLSMDGNPINLSFQKSSPTVAKTINMPPTNGIQQINTSFLNLNASTSPNMQSVPQQNSNFSPPYGAIHPPQNPMNNIAPQPVIMYSNSNGTINHSGAPPKRPSPPLRPIKPKINAPISVRIQPQEPPGGSSTGALVFPSTSGGALNPGTAEQQIIQFE